MANDPTCGETKGAVAVIISMPFGAIRTVLCPAHYELWRSFGYKIVPAQD